MAILLLLAAFIFRLIDIFVLELDKRWGEIIVSKALGFGLVVVFLWAIGKKLTSIGFHRTRLGQSLLIGFIITILPLAIAYAIEWFVLGASGQEPELVFAAIDPKAGVIGGGVFALFLVVGNFVNSFMEEGLFRGVMLNLNRLRLSAWRSNWLQALLFGIWHLVWVVRWYQTGVIEAPGEIGLGVVANFLPQLCLGLVWGYVYLKTNNLWGAWLAHTLTNTSLNLAHIATLDEIDPGMSIRMTAFSMLSLLAIPLIRYLAKRWIMPEHQVWESEKPSVRRGDGNQPAYIDGGSGPHTESSPSQVGNAGGQT
jgi:membrane protease YdiL (CAAX protease family)